MRLPLAQLPVLSRSLSWGPVWIGIGLGLLVANFWCTAVPVVTPMALVALGATAATADRFSGIPHGYLVIVLSLAVYCGLYALFVGATLHSAGAWVGHHIGALQVTDLIASAWPAAAMFTTSWRALRRSDLSR
jgi:hypothetical protein